MLAPPARRMWRHTRGLSIALICHAIMAIALATSLPSYAQQTRRASETNASTSPAEQKVFKHEGLYLQASIGAAYFSSDFHSNEGHVPSHTVEGWGLAYGARLGSTWSGFTLGFGLEQRTIWATKRDDDGGVTDERLGVFTLGPFLDWYVDPRGGFHVGAMPGTGSSNGVDAGLNISVWLGYDLRIKGNWWVGVEPRYLFGPGFHGSSSSTEALFVVTYNGRLRLRGVHTKNAPPRSTPSRP
jgi:hypothetical protein